MMLVCIDNLNNREQFSDTHPTFRLPYINLTVGKKYTALNPKEHWNSIGIAMVNDLGMKKYYHYTRFKPVEEVRQDNLNKLGI